MGSTTDPTGNPCRAPGTLFTRWAQEEQDHRGVMGAWWWLLLRGCCLWEGVRTLICPPLLTCAFPPLMDKPPEQDDTMEPMSTACLCPTIQVRNAELLLTEKQQPNWDVSDAKAELCMLHLLLPTSLSAPLQHPPHLPTEDSSVWLWTHTLVSWMDHNSNVQFRTQELNNKTLLCYCNTCFQIGFIFFPITTELGKTGCF